MAILKCKMCGGTLQVKDGDTVAVCEYCNTKQTLPKLNDERRLQMYERANHFRRNNEFDKAMGVYEQILLEDNTDAESYWSLVLCRYGIEYVEDPILHSRIPTVNRTQKTSVLSDEDYKSAIQYADIYQKDIYEKEAKKIDEIQKKILEVSEKEEPFDIFICYKETDMQGRRTPDSVLATDLYYQLIKEGYKVFFSRITLEDKLGTAYEPYIFAALNSAKIMIVLGTKAEYFNAVWVKNEWKRYLALIKDGADKVLIPAYKDMDPYDLPEDFSYLQSQDMSKLGFMQDMLRGIEKILVNDNTAPGISKNTDATFDVTINGLVKRLFVLLEDQEWGKADEYCEKILDMDSECAEAYIGKLLVSKMFSNVADLIYLNEVELLDNINFSRALKFSKGQLKDDLNGIVEKKKQQREEGILHLLELAKQYQESNSSDELQIYEKITANYPNDYRGWWERLKYEANNCMTVISIINLSDDVDKVMCSIDLLYSFAKKSDNYEGIDLDKEYQICIMNMAKKIDILVSTELKRPLVKKEDMVGDLKKSKKELLNRKNELQEEFNQSNARKRSEKKGFSFSIAFLCACAILFVLTRNGIFIIAGVGGLLLIWSITEPLNNKEFLENKKIEQKGIDDALAEIDMDLFQRELELNDIKEKNIEINLDDWNKYLLSYGLNSEEQTQFRTKIQQIQEICAYT